MTPLAPAARPMTLADEPKGTMMNAVNALFREQQEAEFADAVAAANEWAKVGKPIILATLRLDDEVESELLKLYDAGHLRDFREAKGIVADARRSLEEMLDGIRDEFLADQMRPQPAAGDEAAWEARDAFSDALSEEVISVRDLVKQIEREDYDAFIKGKSQ
jgi:hypothetical protein